MKFFLILFLSSVVIVGSSSRHVRVKRQTSSDTSTKVPPANPEITTVYKVTCDCPFTPQYSPVCGSDGQNYGNRQILECARICGANVTLVYDFACGSNRG